MIIKRIAGVAMPSGYTSLMCMLLLSFGVIMACIGLLGEYVGRAFMGFKSNATVCFKRNL